MEAIEQQLHRARDLGIDYGLVHRGYGRHDESPLSGQWADEWTMTTVFVAVMNRPPHTVYDADLALDLAEEFEEGYHAAVQGDAVARTPLELAWSEYFYGPLHGMAEPGTEPPPSADFLAGWNAAKEDES